VITIAITDDDILVARLLGEYLHAQPGLEVLFISYGGDELLTNLLEKKHLPDILFLDLKMKQMDGIEVLAELKKSFPSIRVIIISSHYQHVFTGFMVKMGVAAFLPKEISPDTLLAIVQAVYEKGYYLMPEQVGIIREQISSKVPIPVTDSENSLSEREIEILRLLCRQKTAKEIGKMLFITQRTVEGHKNNLFAKTGAKNVAGLVIYAIQRGIIGIDELPVI
jgi:DNA-binding NarL/FixJ family response regulator